jgi:hypothetical protein
MMSISLKLVLYFLKIIQQSQARWFMPIIPATQEAEVEGSESEAIWSKIVGPV